MQKLFSLIAFFFIFHFEISAQRWPGNIIYSVGGSTTINMKDTLGNTTKQWTGLTSQTGYSTHLMPGGIFWRSANYNGNVITGGGVTGKIQKYDWNGTLLWDYIYSTSTYVMHHDHCPLPNGNVLLISYDVHSQAEIAAIGGSSSGSVKFDKIVEVKPTGPTTGVVVWEWRFWDHLCQTTNATLPNYVSSAVNNPQLLSMSNVTLSNDFIHANGIDYNEELDQIVLSSHFLHEWFIIDHSTTTAEAASHSGGISGKGGDFLYRWGKPSNYGATGATNFNVLHDAHWVKKGVPRAGSIVAIHNNPNFGPSYIDWAKPTLNGYLYNYTVGQTLPPLTYDKRLNTTGYTSNMGNSLQFPNGNTQVCLAFAGNNQFREFDSLGNQLWQFTSGNTAQIQRYSNCEIDTNSVRAYFDTFTYFRCPNSPSALQIDAQHLKGVGTYTYQWSSYPTASSLGTGPSITVNPNSTTSYTVTITSGACSATASVIVRVETPKANAGNDVTIAMGSSYKLKATGGLTYLWSNGKNTDTNTVSPTSLTSYIVTVTNKYGCTATDTVEVNVLPKIVITASATPSQICKGDSSMLNVSATGGNGTYTYQWSSVPVGLNSTASSVKVTPIVTTTYKVVVSSGGLKDSVYVIDTVKALPNIDAGFNTTILNGSSVFLQASGGTSYVWSNGKTTDTMTVSPSVITTYYVTGTGNGCINKDSVIVNVLPKFIVNATISTNNICFGDSVQLNVNASGATGSYSYLWSSTPIGFSSTIKNPKAKPALTTTLYRVITTSGSFKDTQNISVSVFPYPNVDAGPNVAINYDRVQF